MTVTLSPTPAPASTPAPPPRPRRWPVRAALAVLLVATAALYLWNLSASGWANAFYSAAAQAGAQSWKAWFFGSSDAANWITVDKAPGALWISGLSVRLFGLSSWSILVPQALMGVAAVGALFATVRRTAGPVAGVLAGAALAITPVATLIFRFNNPDALLTLLLVLSAYATLRAVEAGRTRWLLLAAALVGYGFLAKMLQAFLVLPALAAVWLLVAPVGMWRRLRDLALAALVLVVSAGWWVLVVELWPAADRPYIGGSQTNSALELVFGYNGFGRITGDEVGSVGGGAGGVSGGWGETGLTRLLGAEFGGQASWLLPAALVLLGALLWRTWRAPRTDPLRAAAIVWGGWLLITALVFSLMGGIIHPYYVVVLAPAIAALVGIGAVVLWRARSEPVARATLSGVVALTALWAFVLLRRTPQWQPWLSWTVLALGALGAAGLLLAAPGGGRGRRALVAGAVGAAVLAGAAGPAGYSLATAATAETGAIPSAGPAGAGRGGFGGPGGVPANFPGGGTGGGAPGQSGTGAPGQGGFGTRGGQGTGTPSAGGNTAGGSTTGGNTAGGTTGGTNGGRAGGGFGGQGGPGGGRGGGGGFGGLLNSPTPPASVVALLQQDAQQYTWAAAAIGSNTAAGYQLAAGQPVIAVGGFNGTDPSPTPAQFQQLVAEGKVHWFVGGTGPGGSQSGGSNDAQQIAEWVAATYTPTQVDGTTLYDLTAPR